MFFFFVCGEHTFQKQVPGYEGAVYQCYNCGNMAGHVIKSNPWFTFCWIPVLPLSLKGYTDVKCHICNFAQPLANRPDVQGTAGGHHGGHQQPPPGHAPQGHAPPGWSGHQQQQHQPPPNNGPMRYG